MKSERITRTWEFYRDNCDGFREPMRKELRELDGYVSSIEAENAKLRSELESVGTAAYLYGRGDLKAENAKLKDSLQDFYDVACAFYRGIGTEDDLRDLSRQMRELRIEVEQ